MNRKNTKNTLTTLSVAIALAMASSAFAEPAAGTATMTPLKNAPSWLQQQNVNRFDFVFKGDILDALLALNNLQPGFTILSPSGKVTPLPVAINLHNATLEDALRAIGDAGGVVADLQVMRDGNVRIAFRAPIELPASAGQGRFTVERVDSNSGQMQGTFTVSQAQADSMGVGLEPVPTPRCLTGCDDKPAAAKSGEAARLASLPTEQLRQMAAQQNAAQRTQAATPNTVSGKPAKIVAKKSNAVLVPDQFDFYYQGDIQGALRALQEIQPQLTLLPALGPVSQLPVTLDLKNVGLVEALKAIEEQGGDKARVIYTGQNQRVRVSFRTPSNFGANNVEEAKKWQGGGNPRPILGADGLLQFPFGEYQPEITCAPLRACDIELQAGETINNVILGDTVRWIPAPAKTGEGSSATPHVIIKPTDKGLQTNLVVTTNRRTYVMTLKSSDVNYISRAGFYYPHDMVQDWTDRADQERRKKEEEDKRTVSDLPLVSADQLNFNYKLKGDESMAWYPTRVFDDGTRVFIQMPAAMKSSEAPALVLLDKGGNSQLVNYRVKDAYYIVDKLFDRAALIVGVGSDQQKIEITKKSSKSSGFSLFGSN